MSTQNKPAVSKKRRPRIIRVSLITVGTIFLLYLLSEGPAYRLSRKNVISQETFTAAYLPIIRVCDRYKWCDDLVYRYDDLWYSDAREVIRYLRELKSEQSNSK